MSSFDFDLFTIGAGSGGVRASRMAAGLGRRVAIAEERDLGGTCVNLGCVPKKLMVYAAQLGESIDDGAGYGWSVVDPRFDWSRLMAAKNREIARLNQVYGTLLDSAGVRVLEGRARLVDAHTVEVDGARYTAEHLLLAPGGRPWVPAFPGVELAITSDEVFHLERLPRRLVIVGGGYIAVEFAGIFNALGTEVVQLYRGPLFLRGFDDDLRSFLAREMRKRGVDLRFGTTLAGLDRGPAGIVARTSAGESLEADLVLAATGRCPNTADLGLEEVGVALGPNGAVKVDAYSRTSVGNIFAVGDCTDRMNLTPVALAEAMAFVDTLYRDRPTAPSYDNVPTAVFSQPCLGTVGLTEAEARQRFPEVDVYRSEVRPLKHAISGRSERALMKIVVDRVSDRVLGVHMVGPDAGEIIQGMAVALVCQATKAQLDATIGVHPTAAEELVTMRAPVR